MKIKKTIETSFNDEIIPNLINESQARSQMEELIRDSIPVIGTSKADELIAITDNATFFTQVIRYAILSDHEHSKAFSPDLSEDLQNCFLPPVSPELEKVNLPDSMLIRTAGNTPISFTGITQGI